MVGLDGEVARVARRELVGDGQELRQARARHRDEGVAHQSGGFVAERGALGLRRCQQLGLELVDRGAQRGQLGVPPRRHSRVVAAAEDLEGEQVRRRDLRRLIDVDRDGHSALAPPGHADAVEERALEGLDGAARRDQVDLQEHAGEHLAAAGEAGERLLVVHAADDAVVGRIERAAADDDVGRVGVRGHREQRVRRVARYEVAEGEWPAGDLRGRRVGVEHGDDVGGGGAAGQQSGERAGELAPQTELDAMTHRVGQHVEHVFRTGEGVVEHRAGEARISVAEAAVVELGPEVIARFGEERRVVDRVGGDHRRRHAAGHLAQRWEHRRDQELRLRVGQRAAHPARRHSRHAQQTDQQRRLVGAVAGAAPQRAARAASEPAYTS